MSRIPTPATIDDAPEASRPLLKAVEQQFGGVPNMFRVMSNSPEALKGFLGLHGALGEGKLDVATRERLALAIAEINGCEYCLAAHTVIGENMAKLTRQETIQNRQGTSGDAKADAALRLGVAIAQSRGKVDTAAIEAARTAGFGDAEIVEIVVQVATNTLTNYVNSVLDTDLDFPAVDPLTV